MRVRPAAVAVSLALSLELSSAALAASAASPAAPLVSSKMLTDPALSAERIAFVRIAESSSSHL